MTLVGELGAFDGRDHSTLEAIRERRSPTPAGLDDLVDAVSSDKPADAVPAFAAFLGACCGSRNPFVRAWAPDALVRLAAAHPRFGGEARARLEAALADPRASVRARAHKTLRGE